MPLTVVQLLPAMDAGGVERGTLEVARELVRRGHRAIVVSRGGRLVPGLEQTGAEHVTLDIGRKSPLVLGTIGALRRLLQSARADIVHARSRLPAWICLLALRGMPDTGRPRFMTTVHGPYSANGYSGVMARGERVIAISNFIRDYILRNYPRTDPSRVRTIHRGVDAAEFPRGYRPDAAWLAAWHAQFPQLRDQRLITLPGRITRWKGHADFIRLVQLLRERGIPVHGLIAGGAEPRRAGFLRELRDQVRASGLEAAITFTGARADLREVMAISRVVLSLANEPEAFGRTALEALCLGVPVVAYDHGGATEVLSAILPQGLVAPADVAVAADRVQAFLARPPAVTAANPFTLERMLEATLSVYGELAGPGHAPKS
jgi:glycosyltransferase involved in cell wall biosynthesis